MTSVAATISVVIPAYNVAAYIGEAIASVCTQTFQPFEIIVVDDGSTDATASVVAQSDASVRVVSQANVGPAGALNRGIAMASGSHLAFVSGDDRWASEKLAVQVAAFARGAADLVFGHVQHFVSPDLDPAVARTLRCPPDPMPARSAGTMLTSRSMFDRVGPFSDAYRAGEFFEWCARADDLGLRSVVVPEVVSWRRVHASNHSRTTRAPTTSYGRVLKDVIDRRRRATPSPDPGS